MRASPRDLAVLVVLVAASAALALQGLGFYSDDWTHLAALEGAPGGSFAARYAALADPNNAQRPAQLVWLVVLHGLFGRAPLGYHLVNVAVLAACTVLLYIAILEVAGDRAHALASAALFALLPHYTAARFWIAAAQVPLSVALALASLLAGLRAIRCERLWHRVAWSLASAAALALAGLAYETVLPLALVGAAVLARKAPRERLATALLPVLFASAAVLAFKAAVSTRIDALSWPSHLVWFSVLEAKAFLVSFVKYGAALPIVAWRILAKRPEPAAIAIALSAALLLYAAVMGASRGAEAPPRALAWRRLGFGALVVFFGWAIFLTNKNASVTTSGVDSRLAMAATLGVAIALSGAASVLASFARSLRAGRIVFAGLVAGGAGAGLFAVEDIGGFWVRAYEKEQVVLADIRRAHPMLPPGATLLLDGVCPYEGPAIVFESYWDLAGALRLGYGDPTLRADVVTPSLTVRPEAIQTVIYGTLRTDHPYGPGLILHRFGRHGDWILDSEAAARSYFASENPDRDSDCPAGAAGRGVGIY